MSSLYVTEAGSFIKRDGGHVVVGRNNEVLFEVPLERIEDITVFDSVSITSSLVTDFIERGVPITWLSGYGKYFGTLINTNTIDINKHKKQFDLLDDNAFRVGTGWAAYSQFTEKNLTSSDIALPNALYMLELARVEYLQKRTISALEIEPIYLRNEVTWKKLPGRE